MDMVPTPSDPLCPALVNVTVAPGTVALRAVRVLPVL